MRFRNWRSRSGFEVDVGNCRYGKIDSFCFLFGSLRMCSLEFRFNVLRQFFRSCGS